MERLAGIDVVALDKVLFLLELILDICILYVIIFRCIYIIHHPGQITLFTVHSQHGCVALLECAWWGIVIGYLKDMYR